MMDGWTPSPLALTHDGWELVLSPEIGGAIIACRYQGHDILRPATEQWHGLFDPMQSSSFPLIPYSNRIENGDLKTGEQERPIAPNYPTIPHPIHGTAWGECWEIVSQSENACELVYTQTALADTWPYAFEARQQFRIVDSVLHMDVSVKNTDIRSMPAGVGIHPYFHKAGAHLQFNADGVWLTDSECLPEKWSKTIPEWDFTKARSVSTLALDHCFTEWDGHARISWDDSPYSLDISADNVMKHAVVYTGDADSFCFEPSSHMNNAVHWLERRDDTGLRLLASGETMTAKMKFSISQ